MAGPHTTVARARNELRALLSRAHIAPGRRLLVACSGGSDSMALAQAALFVGSREGYLVDSVTVDHGLRGDSAREAEHVAAQLRAMGVRSAETVRVSVGESGGPEAGARRARYAALAALAQGNGEPSAVVLLGHTADDQAETVLLGLARGSGARSIRGMAAISCLPEYPHTRAVRPLLGLRREDLREGLRSANIAWVEDPTNEPTSSWRARDGTLLRRTALRHHSLPALEQDIGPGVVEALARTARLLQADEEALDGWARREIGQLADLANPSIGIAELRALPAAIRTRVLRDLALRAGARAGELVGWHIDHLDELVTGPGGGRGIDLPGVRASQRAGRIAFDGVGLSDYLRKDSDGCSRYGSGS